MTLTGFRPQTNGFAFVNSWTFDGAEYDQMMLALQRALGAVPTALADNLSAWAETLVLPALRAWVIDAAPQNYGLCGGMACAALDHYCLGQTLPRGQGYHDIPAHGTPDGSLLRNFLLRRQLQSMALNFPRLLLWMAILHIDLPFIEGDGPRWLLNRSMQEWTELKGRIDRSLPWPLMLIGTSHSPFHNHQVLAYGYDDPGDGTSTIYIYDMNCPDKEHTLKLDFRHDVLLAEESCADASRGPLRGFFCNDYTIVAPPAVAPR